MFEQCGQSRALNGIRIIDSALYVHIYVREGCHVTGNSHFSPQNISPCTFQPQLREQNYHLSFTKMNVRRRLMNRNSSSLVYSAWSDPGVPPRVDFHSGGVKFASRLRSSAPSQRKMNQRSIHTRCHHFAKTLSTKSLQMAHGRMNGRASVCPLVIRC